MIKYPAGLRRPQTAEPETRSTKASAAGRGMQLEADINQTNDWYRQCDRAVVYKKPTPVTIVKVDYPERSAAKITEAYFKVPSTTDYNGIYKGRYIDFEAKECRSRTSFPIKSIHPHQISHLEAVERHGAIAFVIVRFVAFNETFYIPAARMISYIHACGRSSIPYPWFQENGYALSGNYVCPVDYLAVIDQLYFKENK